MRCQHAQVVLFKSEECLTSSAMACQCQRIMSPDWHLSRISKFALFKCNNTRLQLKKSKRVTVRHFYSLVPMSVVLSPKATSQESSPGAPKVFR